MGQSPASRHAHEIEEVVYQALSNKYPSFRHFSTGEDHRPNPGELTAIAA